MYKIHCSKIFTFRHNHKQKIISQKPFLTAEWRKLAIANYLVDPNLLKPYLPGKTELDFWEGNCYVSIVGFMFLDTRLKGYKIPFHTNFEEVNLRFYVRYHHNGIWKRGVTFIKEIVPRPALTFVANTIYKEKYETLPMTHRWIVSGNRLTVEYKWKKGSWNSLMVIADPTQFAIMENSEEEFITEHYWGYTKAGKGRTSEYAVEHPRWTVYTVLGYEINVDFGKIYGPEFSFLQNEKPKSVMLAEGSEIMVRAGTII